MGQSVVLTQNVTQSSWRIQTKLPTQHNKQQWMLRGGILMLSRKILTIRIFVMSIKILVINFPDN